MKIEVDRASWIAGFLDGERGHGGRRKAAACGYSYHSGYIEGDAKRQGYSYSLGTLKPEDIYGMPVDVSAKTDSEG